MVMLRPRDEGDGGRDGIVLNMTLSGDGISTAVYSIQVFVGKSQQSLMLSVDTGSSDIWLASNSCSSSPCLSFHATLYNPSDSSVPTNMPFDTQYLRGSVSGSIVWDVFKLGPYVISSQALAAVDQVSDESLSPDFVGLLGLALPPNSLIEQKLPSTESDAPDGATLQQNLFGLTPVEDAPEQRFFSLSLERPGSSRIPSLLGIGRHPATLVPGFDPSKVDYAELISSRLGDTFWRVSVTQITAWVNGQPEQIQLGGSTALPGNPFPVALVDSGGPTILTTVDIANAIYGAWSIGPGQDGNYYVDCKLPLNISLGIMGLPPIPLHPLDITQPPPSTKNTSPGSTCVGQIQAATSDQLLGNADIVLGVAFLRNVYSVLSSSSSDNISSDTQGSIRPRLGLFPLTDPTTAMSEFHNVRVLGQPLDPSASHSPSSSADVTVGKHLSVGVTVLIAIIGFFVACGGLFAVRWFLLKRRFKRENAVEHGREDWMNKEALPDEDTLRTKRWEEGKKKGLFYAESSMGSEVTRIEQGYDDHGHFSHQKKDEADALAKSRTSRSLSPASSISAVAHARREGEDGEADPDGWGTVRQTMHIRTLSELATGGVATVPLLEEGESSPWSADGGAPPAHERVPSTLSVSFPEELGMAGVGARSSTLTSGSSIRPASRPRGARALSSGSVSSLGSRTWRAEVGQVLSPVDSEESERR